MSHPGVAEAAVVGAADATTGQAIIAYVTPRGGSDVHIAESLARRCATYHSAKVVKGAVLA